MKSFRSFVKSRIPGGGFEGTNRLRKNYIAKTPYQVDPLPNAKTTPHLEETQNNKMRKEIR